MKLYWFIMGYQMWLVCAVLGNFISPWIVNDIANET